MHIPWVSITQPITEKVAVLWERQRRKGKFLWVICSSLISLLVLSLIYFGIWAIDWKLHFIWLPFWLIFSVARYLYIWSENEDHYAEYKLSAINSGNKVS